MAAHVSLYCGCIGVGIAIAAEMGAGIISADIAAQQAGALVAGGFLFWYL